MLRTLKRGLANTLPSRLVFPIIVRRAIANGQRELTLVPFLCRSDRSFVDVGANIGIYTFVALKHSARVIAVEPHPGLCAKLRASFPSKVEVLNFALSDQTGVSDLFIPVDEDHPILSRSSLSGDANPEFAQRRVPVQLHRLDDLSLQSPQVIKIDVEGHEQEVLKGAAGTISKYRPVLIVEIEERHHPGRSKDIFELLKSLGYQSYFLMHGQLQSCAGFDFAVHQRAANAKGHAEARHGEYINNFIFLPGEDHVIRRSLETAGFLPGMS